MREMTLDSNPEWVKLTQVAIVSPQMQPCTVYLGASCGDVLRQIVAPNRYYEEYNKNFAYFSV